MQTRPVRPGDRVRRPCNDPDWRRAVVPILEYGMQKNTVSHFELYASDPKKLADFYTKMFDWKVTEMPQSELVQSGDTDKEGMLRETGTSQVRRLLF